MSSRDQLKAKSLNRMKKRNLRGLRKKNQGPGGLDDGSDDDSAIDSSFMAIPRQVNAANQGKAETKRLQQKRQKILTGAPKSVATAAPATPVVPLPPPDFSELQPFSKSHWNGGPGEVQPSEDLKTQRKEIGVLVKGNLQLCPPPVTTLHDTYLPPAFPQIFHSLGLSTPSPIQMQCWPAALCGANILAVAPTGSGKTFAYALPMIPHIEHQLKSIKAAIKADGVSSSSSNSKIVSPFALILLPTRELAIQVASALKTLRKSCSLRSVAVYGGQDKDSQIGELMNGGELHIIAATPGRLLDLMAAKKISLSRVTYLVIDEADRMLALGFVDQLEDISKQIRSDRQTLLFTATFPGKLRDAADSWISDAVTIRCNTMEIQRAPEIEKKRKINDVENNEIKEIADNSKKPSKKEIVEPIKTEETAGITEITEEEAEEENLEESSQEINTLSLTISPTVAQAVHVCAGHKKPRLLIRFITTAREQEKLHKVRQPGAMLIFATKIKSVKFVVDFLQRQGIQVDLLHGQLPQSQRERALGDFKAGKTRILVSTDVAARGIHIKRLQYVVNYDFPSNLEQYCHRVGRTGRQGEVGQSYSLVTRNMAPLANSLVALLRSTNQVIEPNLEALASEFSSGYFVLGEDEEELGVEGED